MAATMAGFRPHALHDAERSWPETNCYVDLWIEVLASRGHDPAAMLGFTVRQDFEGDQFTFFKVPLEDLEALYGVIVQELAVFDTLDSHIAAQLQRGRLPLVEVDGFYLPDTDGVSYRLIHTKTTIGVTALDVAARRIDYFHNAGRFTAEGEDVDGLLRRLPHQQGQPDVLFPYTEFAKFGPAPEAAAQRATARRLFAHHLKFAPAANPVAAFAAAVPAQLTDLATRPPEYFHVYAFNTLRQLGANFELLASHLAWLDDGFDAEIEAAQAIASGAKSFQFQLARALARRKFEGLEAHLQPLIEAYDRLFAGLRTRLPR